MEKRKLRVGEVEKIALKTSSDGGYRWQVKYDPDYVEIYRFTKPLASGFGATTLSKFHIKVKKVGKFSVDFYNCQPSLGYENATKHEVIEFDVEN